MYFFFLLHFLVEGIKNHSLFWHQYSSIFSSEIIRLYFHIQVLNLLKKKRCVDLLTIRNKWIGRHAYLFYNLYDSSHIWNFKRDAILSTVCCTTDCCSWQICSSWIIQFYYEVTLRTALYVKSWEMCVWHFLKTGCASGCQAF